MSTPSAAPPRQPGEPAGTPHEGFLALFAGPLAWVVQVYSGYALASEACYPGPARRLTLPSHLAWTRAAIAIVMIGACLVSLLALASSVRAYRRTGELQRDASWIVREASQRTCFLALWGIVFSAGAAVGSIITLLAYFVLPQCAG